MKWVQNRLNRFRIWKEQANNTIEQQITQS